ncbi:hypothetical protein M231_07906 [Tremella mesenterica]|uniref:Uncharacterized protein n=1 Tax=Tremella mesenterica TaxID=5217 RepID=A0A4Q1BAY6_TREME|nr:hypothetical protein M231_07906 [Tremella mesenterica]
MSSPVEFLQESTDNTDDHLYPSNVDNLLPVIRAAYPNNNPTGKNGKRASPALSGELQAALQQYYTEGMTNWKAINERLKKEHGNNVGFGSRSSFFRATNFYGLGTSRKSMLSVQDAAQIMQEEMDGDITNVIGIRAMKHHMTLQGFLLPSEDVHCVFLDAALKFGGFPLQIASDRGSEIGEIIATQIAFRNSYSTVGLDEVFPYKLLKSTRKITIERSWRNVRENVVDQVKAALNSAYESGTVHDGDLVHQYV